MVKVRRFYCEIWTLKASSNFLGAILQCLRFVCYYTYFVHKLLKFRPTGVELLRLDRIKRFAQRFLFIAFAVVPRAAL